MSCNTCELWRKQCTLNTKYVPEYLPLSQRQRWIDAWYLQAINQVTCDDYREKTNAKS